MKLLSALLVVVLAPLLAAQEPEAPPAEAPARTVQLHIGMFEGDTPSARNLAPEVARHAARLARTRPTLKVTEDATGSQADPELLRHEGALLVCMNPWSSKREVLACIKGLTFPPALEAPPTGTQFLLRGNVRPGDGGTYITATLAPMVDGEPGPLLSSRTVLIPTRAGRNKRDKLLAEVFNPLLDAVEGKPIAPAPPPPKRSKWGH
ncbi:MAG: hypothetical protein AB2A00_30195 [Myxococcota bacterium]